MSTLDNILAKASVAMFRGSLMLLDNLGIHVPKGPEPAPDLLEHFRRMYGDSPAGQAAAARTAAIVEARRQRWDGRAAFQKAAMAEIERRR